MFKAIQKMKGRKDRGFTLVELLIVVAIIGILAAIAIPQFGAYRRRGYNASANSDLRNIRTTEEAMMADFTEYGVSRSAADAPPQDAEQVVSATLNLVGGATTTLPSQVVSLSPGVSAVVAVFPTGTRHTVYTGCTGHSSGDNYYGIESDTTIINRKGYATAGSMDGSWPAVCLADPDGTPNITGNNWVPIQ